jgi:hypothetical protein
MIDQTAKQTLVEVIQTNKDSDGWTNLVKVGNPLKQKGIDFKSLGYEKLFDLITIVR